MTLLSTFTSGTHRWIKSLNLSVVKPFRPWIGKIFQLQSIKLGTKIQCQPYCCNCVTVPYHNHSSLSAFDGQVAGYAVEYSKLTYVLFAGGAHQVSRLLCMHVKHLQQ